MKLQFSMFCVEDFIFGLRQYQFGKLEEIRRVMEGREILRGMMEIWGGQGRKRKEEVELLIINKWIWY